MKYLKEKFGKYFQFKNTTNGTDYFLRGLAMLLFVIPIGIFLGIGVAILNTLPAVSAVFFVLGFGFFIPLIWFSLATTYKRINAFFPDKAGLLVGLTFLYSFIMEGFNPKNSAEMFEIPQPVIEPSEYTIYLVLAIPYLIWSLYLLFGNSKVKKHIG
jgi:uncharacterized membrane protein YhaH (DUF805 family)